MPHKKYPSPQSLLENSTHITARPSGFGEIVHYHYDMENLPSEYCPCPNPNCCEGGYNIGNVLRNMLSQGITEYENGKACLGYEHKGSKCYYRFRIKVQIAIKP